MQKITLLVSGGKKFEKNFDFINVFAHYADYMCESFFTG